LTGPGFFEEFVLRAGFLEHDGKSRDNELNFFHYVRRFFLQYQADGLSKAVTLVPFAERGIYAASTLEVVRPQTFHCVGMMER